MSFSQSDVSTLLGVSGNTYLLDISASEYAKPETVKKVDDRFAELKDKDPFPEIDSALLNSEDIIKYILTAGIIAPFKPENLKGATYTCSFSGTYLRYNSKGEADTKTLGDTDELTIEPNSITYLEISEKFRIPSYLILRFNLKVQNVYKGLLLGTGPIVDPGFIGKLYIPLHNLTLNKYVIKKGAELISVEFTKLSIKEDWKISKSSNLYKLSIKPLVFSGLPKDLQKKIKPDRDVSEYIKKSLQDDADFHKYPNNELSVGSSLAEYAESLKTMSEDVKKTKKRTDWGTIIGIAALIITVIALVIPTWQSFDSIQKERVEYRESLSQYQEIIKNLEKRILVLETDDKQKQLDTLQEQVDVLSKEYGSFADKSSAEAVNLTKQISELNEQISALEREIAELQKQLP
jgi:hypothetical protein